MFKYLSMNLLNKGTVSMSQNNLLFDQYECHTWYLSDFHKYIWVPKWLINSVGVEVNKM